MKTSVSILIATASWATALTQQCSGTAVQEKGNWFCGAVNHIVYQGVTGKGSFKDVTDMGADGECRMVDKPYSGPLAPLDEDLSIHIRGPFHLKEAAVYNLAPKKKMMKRVSSPSSQTSTQRHAHSQRRFQGHQRSHGQGIEKREDWVTVTMDGKVVSWINDYSGPATAAPATPTTTGSSDGSRNKAKPPQGDSPAGEWHRIAYYNAEKQVAENVMFLGNYGGQGSGVWDTVWGNSLSYLNAEGTSCSNSPQILKDVYIPSNKEFAMFSAEKCDGSCGYSRVPDLAYKGFSGANKVFLFHFKMPLDGNRDFNGDMSALWALNGRIPRAAQYHECSCWRTRCGEVDILEVLAPGDTKCKSTLHLANSGGSSDYFERPVDKFIKVATVFDEQTASVSIKILPDDTDFSGLLDAETVRSWINGDGQQGSSLFQIS